MNIACRGYNQPAGQCERTRSPGTANASSTTRRRNQRRILEQNHGPRDGNCRRRDRFLAFPTENVYQYPSIAAVSASTQNSASRVLDSRQVKSLRENRYGYFLCSFLPTVNRGFAYRALRPNLRIIPSYPLAGVMCGCSPASRIAWPQTNPYIQRLLKRLFPVHLTCRYFFLKNHFRSLFLQRSSEASLW